MRARGFTPDQMEELNLGIQKRLDVSIYQNPDFLAVQMREIRLGLEQGLSVDVYAKPEFDWFQMEEIRIGLEENLGVRKYADPSVPFLTMRQLRLGLEEGIDLTVLKRLPAGVLKELRLAQEKDIDIRSYVNKGYGEKQLEQIRKSLEDEVDITPYLTPEFRGVALREIRHGLIRGLDVSIFADPEFSWQQMREIRRAMELRLPIEEYVDPLYSWDQLKEIRLGLEDGLDVSIYSSLMYTATEMRRIRKGMLFHGLSKKKPASKKEKTEEKKEKQEYLEPIHGLDGYYEYFFDTELIYKPVLLADGTVDYKQVKWFEEVKAGQVLAIYHDATIGEEGHDEDGNVIPPERGKDLPMLTGSGFEVGEDKRTYTATISGKIDFVDGKIKITPILTLDQVSPNDGTIHFDGTVHVLGDVTTGSFITATKDIIVEAGVEGADLHAGENIILKNGCNANGNGLITAKGDIYSNFFEQVTVDAGGSIHANSSLSAELTAGEDIVISGKKATIAGGIARAGINIVVGQLGNISSLATTVILDGTQKQTEELRELKEQKEGIENEIHMLETAYTEIQRRLPISQRNTNEVFLKVENSIYVKRQELKDLEQDIKNLQQAHRKYMASHISVSGDVYEGVKVVIGENKWFSRHMKNVKIRELNHKISLTTN